MEKESKQEPEVLVETLEAKFLGQLTTMIRLFKEEWEGDRYQPKVSSPKFIDGVWVAEATRLK